MNPFTLSPQSKFHDFWASFRKIPNGTTFESPRSIWDDTFTKNGIICCSEVFHHYKAENHEVPLCPLPRNHVQLPGSLRMQKVLLQYVWCLQYPTGPNDWMIWSSLDLFILVSHTCCTKDNKCPSSANILSKGAFSNRDRHTAFSILMWWFGRGGSRTGDC